MKKIIFSNKHLMKIIYYGLLSMLLLFIILNEGLGNMDELWNFSFAKNIHDGLIPYKDFNLISTPLSCFINSIFLSINTSLITFRITFFIYFVIIIYLLDKIIDTLKINEIFKYLIILLINIILVKSCYLDYNFIQLILILLLVLIHLKNQDFLNKKLNIIIPLISGLAIINKQSSGIIIAFANILLILLNKYYFKKNIEYKFILKQLLITLIPTFIFICYLLFSNSFNDFYDLAILGLTTFTNKYLSKIYLSGVIVIYLLIIIETIINKKQKEIWILFVYSLASLSFIIPILDKVHTAYVIIIPFIIMIYIIDELLKNIKLNIKYQYAYILIIPMLALVIINMNSYIECYKEKKGIYKYIPTNENQQIVIKNVNNYIVSKSQEYDIYILDISATLFNLKTGRYNKYFDMFMNGNFGIKGEKEIYNIINSKNQIFLINDFDNHWQSPQNIIDYIKEEYYICGAIDYLTTYCKD